MNRIKYENYLGAAGYDAVARRKIKELEKKLGPQMVEKVLFDGQLQFAANPSMEGTFAAGAQNAGFQFEDGKTYNILIGDTANNVKAKIVNSATLPVPVVLVGNASFMNMGGENLEDTGESFVAMVMPVDEGVPEVMRGVLQIISTEVTAGDYAVKISTMEEKASDSGNSKPLMFIVTNGQAVLPEGSPSIEEFIKGNLGGAEGSISLIWPQAFVCTEPESLEISICTKVKYESDMSGVNLSFFDRDFTIQIDLSTYRAALVNNKPN